MKKLTMASILISSLIAFKLVFAGNLTSISAEEAKSLQESHKAIIIDVREKNEVANGKVKDAKFIPMSLMNENRQEFDKVIKEIKKNETIIVYCHSGRRAGIVGSEIEKMGYKVLNMGGFDSWKSKNFPVE